LPKPGLAEQPGPEHLLPDNVVDAVANLCLEQIADHVRPEQLDTRVVQSRLAPDRRRRIPTGRVRLANQHAIGLNMSRRGRHEGSPGLRVAHEVAGEEHRPEAAPESDRSGITDHALDPRRQGRDHPGPVVDACDRMAQGSQRPGDTTSAAAEVQDARARRDHRVDHLGLPGGRQTPVEGNGAAVGSDVGHEPSVLAVAGLPSPGAPDASSSQGAKAWLRAVLVMRTCQ
jgi:hypothetical protein